MYRWNTKQTWPPTTGAIRDSWNHTILFHTCNCKGPRRLVLHQPLTAFKTYKEICIPVPEGEHNLRGLYLPGPRVGHRPPPRVGPMLSLALSIHYPSILPPALAILWSQRLLPAANLLIQPTGYSNNISSISWGRHLRRSRGSLGVLNRCPEQRKKKQSTRVSREIKGACNTTLKRNNGVFNSNARGVGEELGSDKAKGLKRHLPRHWFTLLHSAAIWEEGFTYPSLMLYVRDIITRLCHQSDKDSGNPSLP